MERVEPATGLVEPFGDEPGRERRFEPLGVLERVVQLPIGHRARFEPAVEHLGSAGHRPVALVAAKRHRVDDVAVQVIEAHPRLVLEFVDRSDADLVVALIAHPDGDT